MIEIFFLDENVSYDGLCGLDLPLDRKEGVPEVVLPVDEIYTWVHGHLTEQQQEIFYRLIFKAMAQVNDIPCRISLSYISKYLKLTMQSKHFFLNDLLSLGSFLSTRALLWTKNLFL
jgi:hypothetical protein